MNQEINMGVRQHKFPKGMELPIPPVGMELTKFHGEPRFISARVQGDPVNKAGFTPPQEAELIQMETDRLTSVREASAFEALLDYENGNVESQVIFQSTLSENV